MSKRKPDSSGYVYSTNPDFSFKEEDRNKQSLQPSQQKLRIRLETKHRAGKAATIVAGFEGTEKDLEELSKKLKSYCGTGGSAKDGEMIIQGDQREKVKQYLIKNGYTNSK
jgi:translation initiation factor 1